MLTLTVAVNSYDRTNAILDGRVRIEGCETIPVIVEPEEAFHRAFKFQEFDVTEMSLSSHTYATSLGEAPYIGIPAFIFRAFRHAAIYIRTDRGIVAPNDLRGKTIGLPEYQQTANVWARGAMQHEYRVPVETIKWRTGGFEEAGRGERTPLALPASIDCKPIPPDQTLSQLFDAGELDALMSPRAPRSFEQGKPHVARLFPDYPSVELAYFQKTGIFPIMHMVGIRRNLVERYPWLPVSVFKAFLKAQSAVEFRYPTMTSPWAAAEHERITKLLGPDLWSYRLEPIRHLLETFVRYSNEQGIAAKTFPIEELFALSTLELSKI
jgi:4,5-dihydroxyphthalate decarboxylase